MDFGRVPNSWIHPLSSIEASYRLMIGMKKTGFQIFWKKIEQLQNSILVEIILHICNLKCYRIKFLSKFTTEYFHHEENFELLWSKMRWNWTSLSQNLLTKNEQYFNYLSKFITNLQHDRKNFWLEKLRYEEFEQVLLRISSPWLKKLNLKLFLTKKLSLE